MFSLSNPNLIITSEKQHVYGMFMEEKLCFSILLFLFYCVMMKVLQNYSLIIASGVHRQNLLSMLSCIFTYVLNKLCKNTGSQGVCRLSEAIVVL